MNLKPYKWRIIGTLIGASIIPSGIYLFVMMYWYPAFGAACLVALVVVLFVIIPAFVGYLCGESKDDSPGGPKFVCEPYNFEGIGPDGKPILHRIRETDPQ